MNANETNRNDLEWSEANYRDASLNIYRGNPFIEALPDISSCSETAKALQVQPAFDSVDRELSDELRLHLIQIVRDFFQPLSVHLDLEERFSSMLRRGYRNRNPMEKGYWVNINRKIKLLDGGVRLPVLTSSSATGFAILGIPGVGKTTTVTKILNLYPQVIRHVNYRGKELNIPQIVWLKIECPFDGSIKGLCLAFFDAVDYLLGTDYYEKYVGKDPNRVSTERMLRDMARVALLHSIGVLVIDEIQHLKEASSGGSSKMLNFFVQLVNLIGLPVVLVGTNKATNLLTKEFRQARRGTAEGDLIWDRMQDDEEWEIFTEGLWDYIFLTGNNIWTQKLSQVLYDESQGIPDIAVKMFIRAQHRAITTHQEELTEAIIRSTARDDFRLLYKALAALRLGNTKGLMMFEDIYSAVTAYHQLTTTGKPNQSSSVEVKQDSTEARKNDADPESDSTKTTVYPASKAKQRKDGRKLGTGHKTGRQLFMLKDGLVSVVAEGKKENLSAYDALRQAGFIRSATEFLGDDGFDPLTIPVLA